MNFLIASDGDRGNRSRIAGAVLLAVVCGMLIGGCSSRGHSSPVAAQASPMPTARTQPPTAFAARKGTPLPSTASANTSLGGNEAGPAPVALSGSTAFITTGTAVQVVNTATGKVLGSVAPEGQVPNPVGQSPYAGSAPAPPLVAEVGGEQVALAGYVVQSSGHGTTPSSLAVELDAVTARARLAWHILEPLPGQPAQNPMLVGSPDVDLVGQTGSTVVAAVGDRDDGFTTIAFNVASRRPLWQDQAFLASAVVGETVIGTADPTAPSETLGSHGDADQSLNLAGLDFQGKTKWQLSAAITAANVQEAGPGVFMVEEVSADSGNDDISVLHAATGQGKTIANQADSSGSLPWVCMYAGQSIVVCDDGLDVKATETFAVDGTTGDVLWQLPDAKANRTALTVTGVYDGRVYGYAATESNPVVLNGRTGVDVNDSPGVAPVVVDSDTGIALSPLSGELMAYPASAP